eukprot:4635597-Lingulodinium_polyedra.AAC.1
MLLDSVSATNTKEDDFTQQATCNRAIHALRSPCDALFYSCLCTGFSVAKNQPSQSQVEGCEELIQRIDDHVCMHRLLWARLEKVARHGSKVGAVIGIHWMA